MEGNEGGWMQAEYKRDIHDSYLVLRREELDAGNYRVRMLTGNRIPGLLPCRLQGLDGEWLLYYEITGKQAVSVLYERRLFAWEDLERLFTGILEGLKALGEYLLDPDELVLQEEYLYLGAEEVFLCYLPGNARDFRQQFQELMEGLLPRVDPKDSRAVAFVYVLYRRVMDPGFTVGDVEEALFGGIEGQQEKGDFADEKEKTGQEGSPGPSVVWEGGGPSLDGEGESLSRRERPREPQGEGHSRQEDFGPFDFEAFLEEEPKRGKGKRRTAVFGGLLLAAMGAAAAWMLLAGKGEASLGASPLGIALLGLALGGGITAGIYAMVRNYLEKRKATRERAAQAGPPPEGKEELWQVEAFFGDGAETRGDGAKLSVPQDLGESFARDAKAAKGMSTPLSPSAESGAQETTVLYQEAGSACATLASKHPGQFPTIFLDQEMVVVGKLEVAADVILPSPAVSRVHARICRRDDTFLLTDLNSRNGTCVNGRLLSGEEEYPLKLYDEVSFADVQYIFLT